MNTRILTYIGVAGAVASALLGFTDVIGANTAFWVALIAAALAAAGQAIGSSNGSTAATVIGVVIGVAGAVAPQLSTINEKYGRIALLIGAVVSAFGKGFGNSSANVIRALLCFLLPASLVLSMVACGKEDIAKKIRKSIISTDLALNTAENSYQTGFLSFDDRKVVFTIGNDVNATLKEANDFVASLPDDVIDGKAPIEQADKTKLLAILDNGIARANKLVDGGAWFHDEKSRNTYLQFARPIAAGFTSARRIVEAFKVKTKPAQKIELEVRNVYLQAFNY